MAITATTRLTLWCARMLDARRIVSSEKQLFVSKTSNQREDSEQRKALRGSCRAFQEKMSVMASFQPHQSRSAVGSRRFTFWLLSKIHINIPTIISPLAKCCLLINVLINWQQLVLTLQACLKVHASRMFWNPLVSDSFFYWSEYYTHFFRNFTCRT